MGKWTLGAAFEWCRCSGDSGGDVSGGLLWGDLQTLTPRYPPLLYRWSSGIMIFFFLITSLLVDSSGDDMAVAVLKSEKLCDDCMKLSQDWLH